MVLLTSEPWRVPVGAASAVYRAPPVTFFRPSTRDKDFPTTLTPVLLRSGARARRHAARALP
jgi:hypothetical protein